MKGDVLLLSCLWNGWLLETVNGCYRQCWAQCPWEMLTVKPAHVSQTTWLFPRHYSVMGDKHAGDISTLFTYEAPSIHQLQENKTVSA